MIVDEELDETQTLELIATEPEDLKPKKKRIGLRKELERLLFVAKATKPVFLAKELSLRGVCLLLVTPLFTG